MRSSSIVLLVCLVFLTVPSTATVALIGRTVNTLLSALTGGLWEEPTHHRDHHHGHHHHHNDHHSPTASGEARCPMRMQVEAADQRRQALKLRILQDIGIACDPPPVNGTWVSHGMPGSICATRRLARLDAANRRDGIFPSNDGDVMLTRYKETVRVTKKIRKKSQAWRRLPSIAGLQPCPDCGLYPTETVYGSDEEALDRRRRLIERIQKTMILRPFNASTWLPTPSSPEAQVVVGMLVSGYPDWSEITNPLENTTVRLIGNYILGLADQVVDQVLQFRSDWPTTKIAETCSGDCSIPGVSQIRADISDLTDTIANFTEWTGDISDKDRRSLAVLLATHLSAFPAAFLGSFRAMALTMAKNCQARLLLEEQLVGKDENETQQVWTAFAWEVLRLNPPGDIGMYSEEGRFYHIAVTEIARDPESFPDPDAFRLDRDPEKIPVFGGMGGERECPGKYAAIRILSMFAQWLYPQLPPPNLMAGSTCQGSTPPSVASVQIGVALPRYAVGLAPSCSTNALRPEDCNHTLFQPSVLNLAGTNPPVAGTNPPCVWDGPPASGHCRQAGYWDEPWAWAQLTGPAHDGFKLGVLQMLELLVGGGIKQYQSLGVAALVSRPPLPVCQHMPDPGIQLIESEAFGRPFEVAAYVPADEQKRPGSISHFLSSFNLVGREEQGPEIESNASGEAALLEAVRQLGILFPWIAAISRSGLSPSMDILQDLGAAFSGTHLVTLLQRDESNQTLFHTQSPGRYKLSFTYDPGLRVYSEYEVRLFGEVHDPATATVRARAFVEMVNTIGIESHLQTSHFMMGEVPAVAMRRSLGASHPVTSLLWPFLHGVVSVNNLDHSLRTDQGLFLNTPVKIIKRARRNFNISQVSPAVAFAARGLPTDGQWYQDATAYWDLVRAYTGHHVASSYESAKQCRRDRELAVFIEEIDQHTPNGIMANESEDCLALVADICARVIYAATYSHYASVVPLVTQGVWFLPSLPLGELVSFVTVVQGAIGSPMHRLLLEFDLASYTTSPAQYQVALDFQAALHVRHLAMLAEGPRQPYRVYLDQLDAGHLQ
jgi:hypothetical protein